MFSKVAAVAVFALVSASAQAAERFVSTSGNDANAGTLAAPFRTISKAASVAQPGDVIQVRGGVYNAAVSISSKGTAASRITFQSYPGETAVIDGTGLSSTTILVNLYKTEYVDFANFEVRNAPYLAVNARNSKSTRVAGNTIHHAWRNGIYFGSDVMGGTTDVLIENNTLHDNVLENTAHATSGGWAGTLVVSKATGGTIRGNRIYNNDGEAIIGALSNNLVISGNETFDNFSQGVYLDNARFCTVDGNLIYSTGNTRYYRDGYPGQGIAVANETYTDSNPSSDNTIVNNIVIGTRWGFYYGSFENGGGLKNTVVANNTFHKTAQEILRIATDTHANSVIENNIFHTGGGAGTTVGGGGVTFRNNNWYGVNAGAAAGSGDVVGNPNFARAGGYAGNDYRLTAGSAAVAAAADISTLLNHDYFGTPRAVPFDIGAHQYSTGAVADTQAPSVPSGLRAASSAENTIALAWTASSDNVGVAGYTVIRNGVAVANVSAVNWTDLSVSPDVLYSYQLVAYDAAGNRSGASATLSVAFTAIAAGTDTEAPTAVTNFRVRDKTGYSVTLAWTISTDNVGVKEYRMYQDDVHIGNSGTNAFSATSLTPGATYSFSVEAVDAAGNVSPRTTLSVTTPKKRRAA